MDIAAEIWKVCVGQGAARAIESTVIPVLIAGEANTDVWLRGSWGPYKHETGHLSPETEIRISKVFAKILFEFIIFALKIYLLKWQQVSRGFYLFLFHECQNVQLLIEE